MTLLIYGASGYTGELIATQAAQRGLPVVVAGRNAQPTEALGARLAVPARTFSLDEPMAVARGLAGATVLINCAGPFVHTAGPLVQACLDTGVHYLDITGEIPVFEALAARHAQATAAAVMLLPGVGFDVVPSDCLAAHVKRRLSSASALTLAFGLRGGISRGTALTALEHASSAGCVRRDGALVPVPAGAKMRWIDLGDGPRKGVLLPWGDVATAYHTTGIENIEVYLVAPAKTRLVIRSGRFAGPLLRAGVVKRWLDRRIRARPAGPSAQDRATGEARLWAEASDPAGNVVVSRLRTPEAYALTALTAVEIGARVLGGLARAGFHTPAGLLGPDFILGIPGVEREDVAQNSSESDSRT